MFLAVAMKFRNEIGARVAPRAVVVAVQPAPTFCRRLDDP
jgi:hypothetical protein